MGGWAIGGHGWGRVDDSDSIEAVRRGFDLGVTFFDTADAYGLGHSEEILCRALGENRRQVVIATKGGVRWDGWGRITHDTDPAYIAQALEASLRRLKLDRIPLYYIHWPDAKTPIAATMEALTKAQEGGMIGYIGCSNFSPEQIAEAQSVGRIDSVQVAYNLLNVEKLDRLRECCQAYSMAVIAHTPLAQGLLTGKFTAGSQFSPGDIRSRSEYFERSKFKENLRKASRLRRIAAQYGKTPSQVALRWVLDDPQVACVIPGAKRADQVEENVGAADWRLSPADWAWLAGDETQRAEGQQAAQ
jgi:aryl-alcohol dehydrogenase-like predicted oxidoreductase